MMSIEALSDEAIDLLSQIDGSGSEHERSAVFELIRISSNLCAVLANQYDRSKKWAVRCACVYYCMPYARESEYAVELGQKAIMDRSSKVRQRAAQLLAYALDPQSIDYLKKASSLDRLSASRPYFDAAIDAIESKNSNYFVDRDHSGMIEMRINKMA